MASIVGENPNLVTYITHGENQIATKSDLTDGKTDIDCNQMVINGDCKVTCNISAANYDSKAVVTSVGTPIAATDNNGVTVSSNTLKCEYADATHPGIVSTTTQSIAGVKTFSNAIVISDATNTDMTLANGSLVTMGGMGAHGNSVYFGKLMCNNYIQQYPNSNSYPNNELFAGAGFNNNRLNFACTMNDGTLKSSSTTPSYSIANTNANLCVLAAPSQPGAGTTLTPTMAITVDPTGSCTIPTLSSTTTTTTNLTVTGTTNMPSPGQVQTLFFNYATSSDLGTYKECTFYPSGAVESNITTTVKLADGNKKIGQFSTYLHDPDLKLLVGGIWEGHFYAVADNVVDTTTIFAKIYRDVNGTPTLIGTSNAAALTASATNLMIETTIVEQAYNPAQDRIIVELYLASTHATDVNVIVYFEGTTRTSYMYTPLSTFSPTEVSSLTVTGPLTTQSLSVGISGCSISSDVKVYAGASTVATLSTSGALLCSSVNTNALTCGLLTSGNIQSSITAPNLSYVNSMYNLGLTNSYSHALRIGNNAYTRNAGQIKFTYDSGGSTNNMLSIGVTDANNDITFNGNGNISCTSSAFSCGTLSCTGSAIFTDISAITTSTGSNTVITAFDGNLHNTQSLTLLRGGYNNNTYNNCYLQYNHYAPDSASNGLYCTMDCAAGTNSGFGVSGSGYFKTFSTVDASSTTAAGSVFSGGLAIAGKIYTGGGIMLPTGNTLLTTYEETKIDPTHYNSGTNHSADVIVRLRRIGKICTILFPYAAITGNDYVIEVNDNLPTGYYGATPVYINLYSINAGARVASYVAIDTNGHISVGKMDSTQFSGTCAFIFATGGDMAITYSLH